MSKVKLLLDVVSDLRSLADSVHAVADAMLQSEPTVDAEPKEEIPAPTPKKEISFEKVREILGKKSNDGFTEEIRALLLKYGAPKLSGIDPKHYEALLKDVEVLKDAAEYEEILRRELDGLDDEFETLRLLSQELSVRATGLRFRKAA